jgi:hypothetical protein
MAYVPTSEYQGEIDDLIQKICTTLVTQEKYTFEVSLWVQDKKGVQIEKRRPNYEALNHAHPLLNIEFSPSFGFTVQFNVKFIGIINYWKPNEKHFITNSHNIDTDNCNIHMNTIISLESLLIQIVEQTAEQIRRLEKVLFSFET